MYKIVLTCMFFAIGISSAHAEVLSVRDALVIGLAENYDLQIANLDVERAEAGISGEEALKIYANLQKLWEKANAGASGGGRAGIVPRGTGLGIGGSGGSSR